MPAPDDPPAIEQDPDLVVGVLPDVPAIDRLLDYRVPARLAGQIVIGSVVRVPLQGRRVRGWVCELGARPSHGATLREITKFSGFGPDADLLDLAGWAAHRWAGRLLNFVRAATPDRAVLGLPAAPPPRGAPTPSGSTGRADGGADEALTVGRQARLAAGAGGTRVVRWPPGAERLGLARAALEDGPALLLTPSQHEADTLARALRAEGHWIARHPDDWAAGAAGATVIGNRAAAWAPVRGLRGVVVFDEHDARYQDERAPTWNARDVAVERARRAGAPSLLVSPVPSLESLQLAPLVEPSRAIERGGWPVVTVVDRRELDPREGLYSAAVVDVLRGEGPVVVVHNRTGRAKLLACTRCGELCRCEECGAAMQAATAPDGGARVLRCAASGHQRPEVCSGCGATRLAVLRPGVGRVREEVEALVGEPVAEVTAAGVSVTAAGGVGSTPGSDQRPRVWVGTEAVLHRVRRAAVVVFLDLDQELFAPRYRAAEQTLAMLALGARMLGGRRRGGRLILQTRSPDHDVVQAVLHGDPGRWSDPEATRRRLLDLPPFAALALLDGPGAAALAAGLSGRPALTVLGPTDGRYLVRAADSATLADGLAAVPRPPERVRIAVDPRGA